MSDMDAKEVTILRVLAEGGSLELVGVQDRTGWRFQLRTDEGTLLGLLTDEDAEGLEACHAGPWVRSWQEALDQLETSYPYWRTLHPDYAEPAFRAQIVGAFLRDRNTDRDDLQRLQDTLLRWVFLLSGRERMLGRHPDKGGPVVVQKGRYGPYVSHNGIHASIPATKIDTITLEEAVSLLNARADQVGSSGSRGPKSS